MADSIGMTFGRITSAIEKEIPVIKQRVPELVEVYGFGSFFREESFNDIDLIFVIDCRAGEILPASRKLRREARTLSAIFAIFAIEIDALVLSKREFSEKPLINMKDVMRLSG